MREARRGERCLAFIADLMLWVSLVLLIDYALAMGLMLWAPALRAQTGVVIVVHVLLAWLYWALPLTWPMQASMGQWMVGLRVVRAEDAGPLSWRRASRRFFWQLLGQLAGGVGAWPLLCGRAPYYDGLSQTRVVLAPSRVAIDA